MSIPQKINQRLFSLNKFLPSIITTIVIGIGAMGVNGLIANQSDHASIMAHMEKNMKQIEINTMLVKAETEVKFAHLPPVEWKARIVALENIQAARGEQMARYEITFKNLESTMAEIKTIVISLDRKQRLD
jgi:predicted sulfurtransferase